MKDRFRIQFQRYFGQFQKSFDGAHDDTWAARKAWAESLINDNYGPIYDALRESLNAIRDWPSCDEMKRFMGDILSARVCLLAGHERVVLKWAPWPHPFTKARLAIEYDRDADRFIVDLPDREGRPYSDGYAQEFILTAARIIWERLGAPKAPMAAGFPRQGLTAGQIL